MAQEGWKLDQEEAGCQALEGRTYCSNNCGLYGNKATMNMCSNCYRNLLLMQARVASDKTAIDKLSPSILPTEFSLEAQNLAGTQARAGGTVDVISLPTSSLQEITPSRPANRCFSCNKRVGLTGFKCRCGDIFCPSHRYAETHNCSYDYKAAGRDTIAKANPLVKADKVVKI